MAAYTNPKQQPKKQSHRTQKPIQKRTSCSKYKGKPRKLFSVFIIRRTAVRRARVIRKRRTQKLRARRKKRFKYRRAARFPKTRRVWARLRRRKAYHFTRTRTPAAVRYRVRARKHTLKMKRRQRKSLKRARTAFRMQKINRLRGKKVRVKKYYFRRGCRYLRDRRRAYAKPLTKKRTRRYFRRVRRRRRLSRWARKLPHVLPHRALTVRRLLRRRRPRKRRRTHHVRRCRLICPFRKNRYRRALRSTKKKKTPAKSPQKWQRRPRWYMRAKRRVLRRRRARLRSLRARHTPVHAMRPGVRAKRRRRGKRRARRRYRLARCARPTAPARWPGVQYKGYQERRLQKRTILYQVSQCIPARRQALRAFLRKRPTYQKRFFHRKGYTKHRYRHVMRHEIDRNARRTESVQVFHLPVRSRRVRRHPTRRRRRDRTPRARKNRIVAHETFNRRALSRVRRWAPIRARRFLSRTNFLSRLRGHWTHVFSCAGLVEKRRMQYVATLAHRRAWRFARPALLSTFFDTCRSREFSPVPGRAPRTVRRGDFARTRLGIGYRRKRRVLRSRNRGPFRAPITMHSSPRAVFNSKAATTRPARPRKQFGPASKKKKKPLKWWADRQKRRAGFFSVRVHPYRFLAQQQYVWPEGHPRFSSAGRRHSSPYHFFLHRYVRRVLHRRGRRLGRIRSGLVSTPFLRKQKRCLISSPAFSSRQWRRVGGRCASTFKTRLAPLPTARARAVGSNRLVPILLAALRRRQTTRRFLRLRKKLRRRAFSTETRSERRLRRRKGRRRHKFQPYYRPNIRGMRAEKWVFSLDGLRAMRPRRRTFRLGWEVLPHTKRLRKPRHLHRRRHRRGRGVGHTRETRTVRTYTAQLAPLVFQRPTGLITLSAGQKADLVRQARQLKLMRYRHTAQYADGVLSMYSALVRRFIPAAARSTTPHLVHTTYWSMRALGSRVKARERVLNTLHQEMEARTNSQPNRRAECLRRLQSRVLTRKLSSRRGRRFWLRKYHRRKYTFYLEDASRFRSFLTRKRTLLKLRPSPETKWRTRTHITKRTRVSRAATDVLLATERRTPTATAIGCRMHALGSFFRTYSTVSRYLQQRRRQTTVGLRAHTALKTTAYAYELSGKAGVRARAIDMRFTRAKSPRNRRYRLRQHRGQAWHAAGRFHTQRPITTLGRRIPGLHYHRPRALPKRAALVGRRRFARRAERLRFRYRAWRYKFKKAVHRYRKVRMRLWHHMTAYNKRKLRVVRHWIKDARLSAKFGPWDLHRKRIVRRLTKDQVALQDHPIWNWEKRPETLEMHTKRAPADRLWRFISKRTYNNLRRHLRALEWRENDERFKRQHLSFRKRQYRAVPWLQGLMYRATIYATSRKRIVRRDVNPRDTKRFRWLRLYSRVLRRRKYIRRWPKARIYNNRLFRNLFQLPNRRAARQHFRSRTPMRGLANRLDVVLLLLNCAPSIRWARFIAESGVVSVNGESIANGSYQLAPGDILLLNRKRLQWLRTYFTPWRRARKPWYNGDAPRNCTYHVNTGMLVYHRLPTRADLPGNSRLNARLFRWFRLDSK